MRRYSAWRRQARVRPPPARPRRRRARSAASIAARSGSSSPAACAGAARAPAGRGRPASIALAARQQRRALDRVRSSRTLPGQAWRSSARARRRRSVLARRRGSARPAAGCRRGRSRQRRQPQLDHVEAVVQVLAERAGADHRRQVGVGRADHAHLHLRARGCEPRRSKRPVSSTRSSFICPAGGRLPISSRNSVPPSAASNLPSRALLAPV